MSRIDQQSQPWAPRFSIRTLGIFVAVVAAVLGVVVLYRQTMDGLHEAYAKWGLAEMIIAYCEENGRPPSTWDELAPYRRRAVHLFHSWQIEDVRKYLDIDFRALQKTAESPPDTADRLSPMVLSLRGKDVHWEGADANSLLWQYFQSRRIPESASIR